MGAPELPSEEDIRPTHFIQHPPTPFEESDDDAAEENAGYMALGDSDDVDVELESTAIDYINEAVGVAGGDSAGDLIGVVEATPSMPTLESADAELSRQVWSQPRPQELQIELDTTRTEQILIAMQHIKLPEVAVPAWAVGVPEECWKEELLQRIRGRKESTATTTEISAMRAENVQQ